MLHLHRTTLKSHPRHIPDSHSPGTGALTHCIPDTEGIITTFHQTNIILFIHVTGIFYEMYGFWVEHCTQNNTFRFMYLNLMSNLHSVG